MCDHSLSPKTSSCREEEVFCLLQLVGRFPELGASLHLLANDVASIIIVYGNGEGSSVLLSPFHSEMYLQDL